jgi:ribose transport system permease protein
VGELVIQTVFNGFIALGLTDSIQNIILGFFLLVVMGVSENSSRVTEMMRRNKVRKQALAKN